MPSRGRSLPKACSKVLLNMSVFPLSTGLRQRSILDLTWDRIDLERRVATIEDGDTKNGDALGVPLNDVALAVLERQKGKHRTHVFTYRGQPLRTANTSLGRCLEALRDQGFPGTI